LQDGKDKQKDGARDELIIVIRLLMLLFS